MKRRAGHTENFSREKENANVFPKLVYNTSKSRFRDFLQQLRNLNIKGRYLEIGCGTGILAQLVAKQHPDTKITATDISPEMLSYAKKSLSPGLKDRISYGVADACDYNSLREYGYFGLIYTTFTLHHWNHAEDGIRNLYNLLDWNGVLYIQDLKRVWWLPLLQSRHGFFNSMRSAYKKKEIIVILEKAGIKDYSIRSFFPWFMQSIVIRKTHEL